MPFYDFFSQNTRVTSLGSHLMAQAAELLLSRVSESVHPLQRLMEIGPGWGALAASAHKRNIVYTAVDVNISLLARLDSDRRVCTSIPPLPFRDCVYDAVVASHVLEHMSGFQQATTMVSEMCRVVRPGGCIGIVSPDFLWVGPYFWDVDYSHSFPTSARRLHELFLDQGLEVSCLQYTFNHLTGWRGYYLGRMLRLISYRLFDALPNSRFYFDRIYRTRLTFSRSVLIIGRRVVE